MITIINLLINLIESLLYPLFIANYFNFKDKKNYILAVSIIQFVILNFCTFFYKSNLILTILIIGSILISIYYIEHRLTFNHIFITIFYNCLILASAISVLFINNILTSFFRLFIAYDVDLFLSSCLISRILLAIVTLLLLHNKINFSLSFNLKYWSFIILFEFLLLCSIGIITRSLIIDDLNINILILLLIIMIVIAILFIITIKHINDANKIKLNFEKSKQRENFENQKINMIKNIKYEIDASDHRMFYILYNLELLLKQKNYDKAISLLELNRLQINKYKFIIDTGNSIFDYLLGLKINELIIEGVDICTCIIISKNSFYDNYILISVLSNIINLLKSSNKIIINISEKNNYSIIKLYFNSNNINNNCIQTNINKLSNYFKIKYTVEEKQIKFSIKMEEKDD